MYLLKFSKIKTIIILLLLISNFIFYYLYKSLNQTLYLYENTHFLEKNIKRKMIISNQKVKIIYRDKEVVKYKEIFVPEEGKIIIVEKNNNNKLEDNVEYKIIDKGFTFKPGFGLIYNKKIYPQIDFKFFYYKRYGLTVNLYQEGIGISATRYLDDISKDLFSNSQFLFGYDIINKKFFIGVRSSF